VGAVETQTSVRVALRGGGEDEMKRIQSWYTGEVQRIAEKNKQA
jgi:hypothetical protein